LEQSLRASLNLQWRTPEDGTTEVLGVAPDLIAEYPRLTCSAPRHDGIRWIVREQVRPWLRRRDG
jgi:hypothetical protein